MLWYGSDLMLILSLTTKYHKFWIQLWQKRWSHSASSETLPYTLVFIKCHWLQILACLWLAHYANKIPISYFFLIFKGLVRPLHLDRAGGQNGVGGSKTGGPNWGLPMWFLRWMYPFCCKKLVKNVAMILAILQLKTGTGWP